MIIARSTKSRTRVIFDGNSLTDQAENGLVAGQRYPLTCYSSLLAAGKKVDYFNYGIGSRRTATLTSEIGAKFASSMVRPNDIIVFWEITNEAHDLTTDTQGTQLYANVQAYCAAARSYGAKVIVVTGIARDMTGFDDANITDRIFACNALIRANWSSFCDGIADVALLSAFDAKADTTNTTYYNADKTHLTNVGYDLIAGTVQAAIQTLL